MADSFLPFNEDDTFTPPSMSELENAGLGRSAATAFSDGFQANYQSIKSLEASAFDRLGLLGEDRLSVEEANRVGAEYGLSFDRPVTKSYLGILTQQKQEQMERDYVLSRAPRGLGASTALALSGFAGMAADPLNIATAFVPVVGPSRYAAMLSKMGTFGARATAGAIEGVAGAALLEPLTMAGALVRDEDYGIQDTMANLVFGGILGGGLHSSAGLFSDAIRGQGFSREALARGREINNAEARLAALGEEFDRAARNFDPAAPAPVTLSEKLDAVSYGERADLTSQAVAQGMAGKAVDVGGAMTNDVFKATGRNIEKFYDAQNRAYTGVFEVVDAKDLRQASGDLQPRDRAGRLSSGMQIAEIAANLIPEKLGSSTSAAEGAPIVSADGTILSGNGRVAALQRAYNMVPERADAYREFLKEYMGSRFDDMAEPVLVRRMQTPLDQQQLRDFVVDAQRANTMQLSAIEQARIDADVVRRMDAALESGDVTLASNQRFVNEFVRNLPSSEANRMLGADGKLSAEGVKRIQNALIANAYRENPTILSRLLESTDEGSRSIAGALVEIAPVWGRMRDKASSGLVSPRTDATVDLLDAVSRINLARESGLGYTDMVAQPDFLNPPTEATQGFISLMLKPGPRNTVQLNSKAAILKNLREYSDLAEKTLPAGGLLGDEATDAVMLIEEVRRRGGSMLENIPETQGNRQAGVASVALAREAGSNPAARNAEGSTDPVMRSPYSAPTSEALTQAPLENARSSAPAAVSTKATTTPSFTAGPSITRGFDDIVVSPYPGTKVRQIDADWKSNVARAQRYLPKLKKQLEEVANGIEGVQVQARVKTGPRLEENVKRKGAQRIPDYLGARFVVDTPDDLNAIIGSLAARGFRVTEKEITLDGPGTEWGWRDARLQVEVVRGFTAEVQIVPETMVQVSDGPGHKIYEKWRSKETFTKEDLAELEVDKARSRALHDDAMMRFMTSREATREIPVVGEVRAEVTAAELDALRSRNRAAFAPQEVLPIPDTLNGDMTLQKSDLDLLEKLTSGERDPEKLLADDMARLEGLQLTDAERLALSAADDTIRRTANIEAAIRASAGCILRG